MSDFLSSLCQRNGERTWSGGHLSSMSASVSSLGESGWLIHVQNVLAGSAWIAARVALESASVLVHCRFFSLCFPVYLTIWVSFVLSVLLANCYGTL